MHRYVLKVSPSETKRSDIKLYRGKLQVTVSAALYDAEMSRQAKVICGWFLALRAL